MLTPEDFLKEKGINLNTTSLLTVVDGYMRQPNLVHLMDEYADLKFKVKNEPTIDVTKDAILNRLIEYCEKSSHEQLYLRQKNHAYQYQTTVFEVKVSSRELIRVGGVGLESGQIISFNNNSTVEHKITKLEVDKCFDVFLNGKNKSV